MGEKVLKKEEGEKQDRVMGEKKDNSLLQSEPRFMCVCDVKEDYWEPGSRPKRRKEKRMGDIWGPEQRIMTQCVKHNNEATNVYAE